VVIASDEHIRTLAGEILARRQYARFRPTGTLELIDRLLHWLDGISAWLRQLADTRPLLYLMMVASLLLASLLMLAHVVYTVRRALAGQHLPAAAASVVTARSFQTEASELAATGRFLEAAHRMQLAVIELLLRRRVVELGRSEPNRTLRQRLRTAPLPLGDRRQLLDLLDSLERQWFRDRGDDARLYDDWCRLHERLNETAEPA
jgi:hypothetical protein